MKIIYIFPNVSSHMESWTSFFFSAFLWIYIALDLFGKARKKTFPFMNLTMNKNIYKLKYVDRKINYYLRYNRGWCSIIELAIGSTKIILPPNSLNLNHSKQTKSNSIQFLCTCLQTCMWLIILSVLSFLSADKFIFQIFSHLIKSP